MKQYKKFDRTQYLQELEKVEQTIERVRSNSKSSTQMSRAVSQRTLNQNTSYSNLPKTAGHKYLVKEKTVEREREREKGEKRSDFVKTKVKGEWNVKGKREVPAMLGETHKLQRCITNLKHKVKQLDDQTTNRSKQPSQRVPMPKQENSPDPTIEFLEGIKHLYCIPINDTQESMKQIVKQIQLRDDVCEIAESKLGREGTYGARGAEMLEEWFQKQRVLLEIISIFKRMSRVDIEDPNELYNFLKEGSRQYI